MTVHAANPKNIVEYPCCPTVGRKMAAIVVETAWFSTSATLIPLERMRVGISSDKASQTQTPGPTAKKAIKRKSVAATIQPWRGDGTLVTNAFSIFSGALRAASKSPNGFEKNAFTLLPGTLSSREISIGFATGSSDRTAWLADRKSPYE